MILTSTYKSRNTFSQYNRKSSSGTSTKTAVLNFFPVFLRAVSIYFSKSDVHTSGLVSRTEDSLLASSAPISKVNSEIVLLNAHITDMSSEYLEEFVRQDTIRMPLIR